MDWFNVRAVQGTLKSLLQHHSLKASILQRSAFFIVQLSHPHMTTGNFCTVGDKNCWSKILKGPSCPGHQIPSVRHLRPAHELAIKGSLLGPTGTSQTLILHWVFSSLLFQAQWRNRRCKHPSLVVRLYQVGKHLFIYTQHQPGNINLHPSLMERVPSVMGQPVLSITHHSGSSFSFHGLIFSLSCTFGSTEEPLGKMRTLRSQLTPNT